MRDIDEMDMLGYLRIKAWDGNRGKAANDVPQYIDDL